MAEAWWTLLSRVREHMLVIVRQLTPVLALIFLLWTVRGARAEDNLNDIISAIRQGDYSSAERICTAALLRAPQDFRLLTLQGMILSQRGQRTQALSSFQEALKVAPDYLPALEGSAQLEYQQRAQSAVPLLERIAEIRPEDRTVHAMLGALAYDRRDCEVVVREYKASEPIIDSQALPLQQVGACLLRLNRASEAVLFFQQIVALDPQNERAKYNLGVAQLAAENYREVIEILSPRIESGNADPDTVELLAEAYEASGDTPRAVKLFREAILSNLTAATYYLRFADICFVHHSYQVGIDMLSAGVAHTLKPGPLYIARGILLAQLGKYQEAERDFQKAETLTPEIDGLATAKGLMSMQEGKSSLAESTLRQRLKLNPKDAFLHYLLAEALTRNGAIAGTRDFEEAIASARKAVELDKTFPLARDLLTELLLRSGSLDEAMKQGRLAVHDNPTDQTALYHLIRVLKQRGETKEIPQLLKQLAEARGTANRKEENERRYVLVERTEERR